MCRAFFRKAFRNAALGTTFLLQSGRTYLLGVVARTRVEHNVTSNTGKVLPHDGNKFKLYLRYGMSGAVQLRGCPDGSDSLNGPNWSVSDKIWLNEPNKR